MNNRFDGRTALLWLAVVLISGGCKSDPYRLTLERDGDQLVRTLEIPITLIQYMEEDEFARLAGHYGQDQVDAARNAWRDHAPEHEEDSNHETLYVTFSGRFSGSLPNDFDSRGYYLHYGSPMGTASVYSEQFGGIDDIAAPLQKQERDFHRLFDVFLLWLDDYAGDAPGYARLRETLDRDIRQDFWSLTLMMSVADMIGPVVSDDLWDADDDLAMRAAHFFVARGYLTPTEIMQTLIVEDETEAMRFAMRIIARKAGVADDEPLPGILEQFIEDPEAVGEHWVAFSTGNEYLRGLVDTWNNMPDADVEYIFEDAKYIDQLSDSAMPWSIFWSSIGRGGRSLHASLSAPIEPYFANGEYDEEQQLMVWRERLASPYPEDRDMPNNLFAIWSEPDAEFQTAHFGQVLLEDDDLQIYCVWYESLADARREEWDDFIAGLTPGSALVDELAAFRFSDDAPEGPSAASVGRFQIQNRLRHIGAVVPESDDLDRN